MATPKPDGAIGSLTLPDLIQSLWGERKTGTLTLRDELVTKTLYFEEGRVVFASSTDPDDRLGYLFLLHGMITLPVMHQSLLVARAKNERLGTTLVKMKAIRPTDLTWGVTAQVQGILLSLFRWTRGEYSFSPGPAPREVITLNVLTEDLILQGIKSIESWTRIEAAVGDLDTRYKISGRIEELADKLNLTLDEWTLLSHCESPTSLGEICEASAMPDFEVCRMIWTFMVVGILERQEAAFSKGGIT